MNEKEKMLQGLLYDANYDKALIAERIKCKALCFEYNNLAPDMTDKKREVLKKLLGKTKENFLIEPSFWCDYGYNIEFEGFVYVNHNSVFLDCAKIKVGANTFIGPNCGFYTAIHPIEAKSRVEGLESAKPITIGQSVWLGGNVIVLPGVTIGDRAVIGAGSVVTKDIPSDVVAVGNPCKVIKNIQN